MRLEYGKVSLTLKAHALHALGEYVVGSLSRNKRYYKLPFGPSVCSRLLYKRVCGFFWMIIYERFAGTKIIGRNSEVTVKRSATVVPMIFQHRNFLLNNKPSSPKAYNTFVKAIIRFQGLCS